MKRLRHPIRAIREPFGTAGLIVAVVALIAALGGSAIAAKGTLTGKQKREVAKIAKHYAGKRGPRGKNGQNGQNGTNGAPGAKGDKGAAGATGPSGTNGINGTNGTNGVSPTGVEFSGVGGPCTEGGVEFESANGAVSYACDGEAGSPWVAGGTLPPSQTETGSWGYGKVVSGHAPITFSIPLAAPLGQSDVHMIAQNGEELRFNIATKFEEVPPTGCTGGSVSNPKADPGNLCVYIGHLVPAEGEESTNSLLTSDFILSTASNCTTLSCLPAFGGPGGGASVAGALVLNISTASEGEAWGTYAVTAPAA